MQSSTILVTGASGFLGGRLVAELVARGARVDAVARAPRGESREGVRWLAADLTRAEEADHVVETSRPEAIVHLASWVSGQRDLDFVRPAFAANLETAVHLLVAGTRCGCRRILLAGSMEEPDLEAGAAASSPYAVAKGAQSLYARFFRRLYATPVVTARIFMAYGPGQTDLTKLVPYAILEGLAGRAARLTSGGRSVDWIYVDDVARGLVALLEAPGIEGETLDLGSGRTTSVGEVAAAIAARLDAPAPALGALPDRPHETARVADPERTFARTGFRPEVTLAAGIDRTIEWYRAERAAGRL